MSDDKKDKQLKDKAIDIKGKAYVLIPDRVMYFNEHYPDGCIYTDYTLDDSTYHFRATVLPDVKTPDRKFTGHSQATIGAGFINKTAAMENAETSAVGRALGFMGIGVIDAIASVDEINKAQGSTEQPKVKREVKFATDKQIDYLRQIAGKKSGTNNDDIDALDMWLEEQMSVPPQKLPIYKVTDAVEFLNKLPDYVHPSLTGKVEINGEQVPLEEIPF